MTPAGATQPCEDALRVVVSTVHSEPDDNLRGGGIGPGIAAGPIGGAVLGGAYGYYDAPGYYDDDSYGYYDNGPYDNSDAANAFN